MIELHTIRIRTYDLSWGRPQSLGVDQTVTIETDRGGLTAIELACCALWGAGTKYFQRGAGEYVLRAGKKRSVRVITSGHSRALTEAERHSRSLDAQYDAIVAAVSR